MFRFRRSRQPRVVGLAVVCLLLACIPAVSLAQEASPASPLAGAYSTTVARDEIPSELAGGPSLAGRWILTFGEQGEFSLARQDVGIVAAGTYVAGPTSLDLTSWSGIVGCDLPGTGSAAARYAWRQADQQLTLTPLDDPCPERLALLAGRPFGQAAACVIPEPIMPDPFAQTDAAGTPVPGPAVASGVSAQEGFSESAMMAAGIDSLLQSASGCWAIADPDRFMLLHSQSLLGQIAMMGPPDQFTRELRTLMATPLRFTRIGEVQEIDPSRAWSYVEVDLGGEVGVLRVDFVLDHGLWLFDSFALFGPPSAGSPIEMAP